jgi:adenylate cyclase
VTVLYEATPVGVLPEVQNGMAERNAGLPPDRRIELRVGIHLGDVVEESDGDLMGDGVNIAARLDGIAKPGAICLSRDAYRQMRDRLQHEFIDLGEKGLKNIARPVRAYTIKIDSAGSVVPAQASGQDKARSSTAVHRGCPLHQYRWRFGAGVFRRWRDREPHD